MMTNKTLIAKPVVKNQLWVVTDGKQKIGNVVAEAGGNELKLGDTTTHFDSTKNIERDLKITFEPARRTQLAQENLSFLYLEVLHLLFRTYQKRTSNNEAEVGTI
jgi:hypothetical protein